MAAFVHCLEEREGVPAESLVTYAAHDPPARRTPGTAHTHPTCAACARQERATPAEAARLELWRTVLCMLLNSLPLPTPNLAQLLLGFHVGGRTPDHTVLQGAHTLLRYVQYRIPEHEGGAGLPILVCVCLSVCA
jgi:hypothetical protein